MSINSSVPDVVKQLAGALIVSCQADQGEPLCQPDHILALCKTVLLGGATALRLEGLENVQVVKNNSTVPIIGLTKLHGLSSEEKLNQVYITGTFEDARQLALAGSDIIALDLTDRPRRDGLSREQTVDKIHNELNKPVWADIATFEEGVQAFEFGADVISTTMFGYTAETATLAGKEPGFELLEKLVNSIGCPVILEGRVWSPHEITRAFELGAYAVVVGSAITRPHHITRRFAEAANLARSKSNLRVK